MTSDPIGLHLLHEPETVAPLDIVFIHGIGGTSKATWSQDGDPEKFWPQTWLPKEAGIKSARILSFGYNATWATTGPTPITSIADFASDLLQCIQQDERVEELALGQVSE